ncbi:hypothetical protein [Eoetvoesiella caeni]|nr:hypothetical protein [Eoetvoesiella caeni]MCI2809702.1 hypothetical protein [Eoetvoesiella caeni]
MAEVLTLLGYEHYEADMFFMQNGSYQYDAARIRDAHAWCQNMTRQSLKAGKKVVVSNTFTRLSEMAPCSSAALAVACAVSFCTSTLRCRAHSRSVVSVITSLFAASASSSRSLSVASSLSFCASNLFAVSAAWMNFSHLRRFCGVWAATKAF